MKKPSGNIFIKLWHFIKSKWFAYIVSGFIIVNAILLLVSNILISNISEKKIYSSINEIPHNKVGIVLGSNRHTIYFKNRINAAARLYHSNKVNFLLVSGDNHIANYDEANDMRKALIKKGVADSAIIMDFAGFRTFDSMVRCKKVFLQDSVTVISQKFQIKRALFIGQHFDLNGVGYIAKDASAQNTSLYIREILARYKAFLDVFILNTSPKFLGKTIEIG